MVVGDAHSWAAELSAVLVAFASQPDVRARMAGGVQVELLAVITMPAYLGLPLTRYQALAGLLLWVASGLVMMSVWKLYRSVRRPSRRPLI